jgi:hypothetical protein
VAASVHYQHLGVGDPDGATYTGEPPDKSEADRVAWMPLADVRALVKKGEMTSGTTIASLLYVLSEPSD